jgi:phosphate/sulfate permease|tara:strand:- start:84 stop:353 length:270 start_codon:yes stop_codon:yes gene_type:complete
MSVTQAVRCRPLTKNPKTGGDIVWHLWYLVGAGGGFAAALFVIGKAAQRVHDEDSREARSNMVWSIVGSLLMMPLSGVMLAAIIFMVMK